MPHPFLAKLLLITCKMSDVIIYLSRFKSSGMWEVSYITARVEESYSSASIFKTAYLDENHQNSLITCCRWVSSTDTSNTHEVWSVALKWTLRRKSPLLILLADVYKVQSSAVYSPLQLSVGYFHKKGYWFLAFGVPCTIIFAHIFNPERYV